MNPIPQNNPIQDGYLPEIKLDMDPEVASVTVGEDIPVQLPKAAPAPEPVPEEIPEPVFVPDVSPSGETYMEEPEYEAETESRFLKFWREKKLFIILSSLFIILAIACICVMSYVYFVVKPYEEYDYILPNVYCAGVDLGGMTQAEAQEAIETALASPSYTVTVKLEDRSYEFCPAQEGITLNSAEVARKAYNYLREDTSAYGIFKAYRTARGTEYHLDADTELVYSVDDIAAQAQALYDETFVDSTDSTVTHDPENHTVSVTLGTPGRELDLEEVNRLVNEAFAAKNFEDITLSYLPVELSLANLWEVIHQGIDDYCSAPVDPTYFANQETHAIDMTMGTPGYSFEANDLYSLAKENIASGEYGTVTLEMDETVPTEVNIVDAYNELACEPKEPYYANGDVQEGTNGYSLDWEAAIASIMELSWGDSLSIPMTVTEPKHTAEEVRKVLFRDELGACSSPHTAIANRTHNLTLACKAINGTVINPGETFSFNGVVGQRTADKGYREATVYVGTESVGELGGGICQVASTIYNAALYAQMDITERTPHIYFVTYVKGGLDATVYWGSLDFCFRNSSEYPIRINASVSGGYVHISIDGTKTDDSYVVLSSTKLATNPYGVVTELDPTKPTSYSEEKTSPYTGYTYEAYQYIYSGNGTLLESNYLGKSVYQKRDQVIVRGSKEPTPVPTPEPTTPVVPPET